MFDLEPCVTGLYGMGDDCSTHGGYFESDGAARCDKAKALIAPMTDPTAPLTAAGRSLMAPPCDCGIAHVYGQAPWGVEHAPRCASRRGIPLNAILNIENEMRAIGDAKMAAVRAEADAALDHMDDELRSRVAEADVLRAAIPADPWFVCGQMIQCYSCGVKYEAGGVLGHHTHDCAWLAAQP